MKRKKKLGNNDFIYKNLRFDSAKWRFLMSFVYFRFHREWTFAKISEEASLWATKVWYCRAWVAMQQETITVWLQMLKEQHSPIPSSWI